MNTRKLEFLLVRNSYTQVHNYINNQHTHIYKHAHTYSRTHTFTDTHKHTHSSTRTQVHTQTQVHMQTHTHNTYTDMVLTGCRAMNSCSGMSPSVTSILCFLANGSSPIIIDEGKPIPIPAGAALNGIGNSPGEVMWPPEGGGGGLVDMLAGGGKR